MVGSNAEVMVGELRLVYEREYLQLVEKVHQNRNSDTLDKGRCTGYKNCQETLRIMFAWIITSGL